IPSGEIKVHIEVLSVLWGNRLPIRTVRCRYLGGGWTNGRMTRHPRYYSSSTRFSTRVQFKVQKKRKKKLKGKSKKEDSDFELETDVVDSSSDEVDQKRKKLKIKAGLKRKRSGLDSSDSSSIDTVKVKRLISKLGKKVKKQENDKENVAKKGKKKMIKKIKKEESDEESVPKKASVVGSVCDVVKEIAFDVVNEKASDAWKNKATNVKKKPALNLHCGLLVEPQLQRDMLRRLRFKFATNILLHEINVHAVPISRDSFGVIQTEFPKDNPKDKERDKAPAAAAVVSEKSTVDEKDNQKVTSKVSKVLDESNKPMVIALILKEKPANFIEKSTVVKERKSADVIEKSTVVNEKEKPVVDVTSKVAKDKEKSAVNVTSKVGKSKVVVHKDKVLDIVLKDKPKGNPSSVVGKGSASFVVGKAKDKPSVVKGKVSTKLPKKKHKADIPKGKPKPKDKHKIKAGVKRKRKGGSDSDSDSADEEKLRQVLKKLKKIKIEYSDKESGLKSNKKGKKKETQITPEEAAHEEYLRFSSFNSVSIDKIRSRLGRYAFSKFSSTTYRLTFKTGDYVEVTPSKIHDILGRVAGLKGQICLDVVRRLHEESIISDIDWCGYIHSCLKDSELPEKPTLRYLSLFTFLIALFKKVEEKVASICSEIVVLEDLMRKASSDYLGDRKFIELQEKYVQVFREPISFDVDVNFVGGNDSDGDDDNDDGNENNDEELNDDNDDGNGNNNKELNDEDNLGSNLSFGFSKIGLDGLDKQPSQEGTDAEKESVDPTQEGTVIEGNPADECEIMSTPKNYTQWLEKYAYLVGEIIDAITDEYLYGDLFGDNYVRMEVLKQGLPTPDRMPTRASNASASPGKRIVKPSSYLLSSYMNKKTKVVPKITRLEFSIGNSLFAMQGDNIENVFETNYEGFSVYGIRLNLETSTRGLWIDANVIDCWGAILNHEEKFRDAKSKSRHFFPPISKSMFNGTLHFVMTNEEASQIMLRLSLKAMKVLWLSEALTCLTSTTSMTILDNSVANYDTKYKEVCDLLKKLFAWHFKLYGHSRHGTVGRLKHIIPKLKWRTNGNFHDCGVFTMLHMESFNNKTAAK
nr:hypothetical protein [Tanacetum cinerariifolium]